MFETSHIRLSKAALANNLDFIRNKINPETRLSCVVKGNAYGHGIEDYVPMAEACGVNHFSVFSSDEARRVKEVCKADSAVMVMGAVDDQALDWAIKHDIEVWIFDAERLHMALSLAKAAGRKLKMHLEVETGMNRTGFALKDLKSTLQFLKSNEEHLKLIGLCTHFAGAESIANYYRIKAQIKVFKKALLVCRRLGTEPQYSHACCSAALLRFPEMQLGMVRIGILQYGFWPSNECFIEHIKQKADKTDPLVRLISWKSRLMAVKKVGTGEYIGYGTSFLAQRDMLIGVVPVGYGQGFSRSLSNQGRALVNGTRVAVIGTVNMNSITLDLTEVPFAAKGDPVTLIGNDEGLEVSVASFGEASNQLNYELLTRLPGNIPREVV